jgi:putative NIF3 family GTP cyclohydrolase 1 type 2
MQDTPSATKLGLMKNKRKKKIHRDKNGREFIKETYFVGGKMKFHRVYVIDGIPADEFYEKNATDLDFYLNGDYELMSSEKEPNNHEIDQNREESDLPDNEDTKDLTF